MNAERLLAHYEKIADAPDAIARLRRFILDLAVRGKLVPQDPNDEPASELLKRIAAEKARLVKAGEIKKERPLAPVADEEPFQIPPRWQWARLGAISSYIQRGKSPKYTTSGGSPVVSQKCVQWTGLDLSVAKQITLESLADYEDVRFIRGGDLLWNSTGTGTIGRIIRVVDPPRNLVCDSHVTIVRCLVVDPEYVRTWLRSDQVYGLIEDRAAGSTNQVELTLQMAISQLVPLPPLAEQRRIVAKVDELMGLCDRLEAARAGREAVRDRLAAASLARLNAPNPETFEADARFALDALPALTTRPDQIKRLRQTILNLAVRGKLVPQDPNDEPASELLKRIAAEKARLVKAGEIRKPKAIPAHSEPPFLIPSNWRWSQLAEIGVLSPRNEAPDTLEASFVPMPLIAAEYGVPNQHEVRPWGEIKKGYTHFAEGDVGLAKITPCFENGKSTVFRNLTGGIGAGTTELHVVRPLFVEPSYILLFLKSAHFIETGIPKMTGTAGQKRVPFEYFAYSPFPLPPLAEQHRIVAKVDEVMALCDRLEESLATADDTRRRLLEALLAEALAPADARELEAAE
jgi:type I restriction enzyme S subunit